MDFKKIKNTFDSVKVCIHSTLTGPHSWDGYVVVVTNTFEFDGLKLKCLECTINIL